MIMMGKDCENKWNIIAPKSGRVKMVSEILDSAVMPGIQGGPLMHIIAAKAIAFGEALDPSFKVYAQEVINNAQTMATAFSDRGYDLISGGTDTHVVLIDLSNKNVNGKVAEKTLEKDFNGSVEKLLEDIGKNVRQMPQIKINNELIGGYNQLVEYFEKQGKVNFKGEIK